MESECRFVIDEESGVSVLLLLLLTGASSEGDLCRPTDVRVMRAVGLLLL